jgi:peptidyl-prolyl cis-trans isomerase D
MLQSIRDRATGVFAWIIVILISVPFALWGVHEYFGGAVTAEVAKVNKTEITLQEFQRAYQQQRQRLQQMVGPDLERAGIDESALRRETLNALIEDELLVQAADGWGLRVGDEQLARRIHAIQAFQRDGRFSAEAYQQALRGAGLGTGAFESQQRRALLASQLYVAIGDSAVVSDQDVDRVIRMQQQQREIEYAVLPLERFLPEVEVSEADIERYYAENRWAFVTPERVRLEYVELDARELAQAIVPEEEAVHRLYEDMAPALGAEEERRASHILLRVPEEAGPEGAAAAREQAEELLARIRAGEPFEALAREHSHDPGSAPQGGDLGFFGRGMMVPAFEEAVFDMQVDEVRGPIESPFGLHIIQLTGIVGGEPPSFEEVRQDLERQIQEQRAERRYYEQAESLTYLTYESPDSLIPAAEALGLEVRQTDWITRSGGEGIAEDPRVVAAAFSDEVLLQGYNSEPIEVDTNRAVVVRVAEHEPPTERPLEEVREDIVEALRGLQAREQAHELAQQIQAAAAAGADLAALASEHDLAVERPGRIGRDDATADPRLLQAVFTMQRPQEQPSYGITELGTGDFAVVAVLEVQDGDPAEASEEMRRSLAHSLSRLHGSSEFSAMLEALRTEAKITIREDRL